jgi:hypothetical protein
MSKGAALVAVATAFLTGLIASLALRPVPLPAAAEARGRAPAVRWRLPWPSADSSISSYLTPSAVFGSIVSGAGGR